MSKYKRSFKKNITEMSKKYLINQKTKFPNNQIISTNKPDYIKINFHKGNLHPMIQS